MAQVQCPNCKTFKTVYKGTHGAGNGVAVGSCLIWIFPPLGILIILADLIVSFFRVTASDNTRLCLNCKFIFKPEPSKEQLEARAKKAELKAAKSKNHQPVGNILEWFAGGFLIFIGLTAMSSGVDMAVVGGFFWLLCGIWLLPPVAKKLDARIGIPVWGKILTICSLFLIGGAIGMTADLPDTTVEQPSAQQ